jgi:hypothetical protein
MITFKPGKYVDSSAALSKAVRRAGRNALRMLGYQVRKTAQDSIEFVASKKEHSEVGTPPHSHQNRYTIKDRAKTGLLQASIRYAVEVNPDRLLAGTSERIIGDLGEAFEHEGTKEFRGQMQPPRPFMAPALAANVEKLPGFLIEQLDQISG